MPASTDRLEFAPPQPPGMLRAFGLAIFAHVLLLLALTWGINWKRDAENLSVEAELWASVPQQAAPKLVEPPQPPPQPQVVEPPKPPPPVVRQAQIAVEKEKKPEPKKPEPKKAEPPKPEPKKLTPPKVEPKPEPPKKVAEAPKPKASTTKQLSAADAKKLEEAAHQEQVRRMLGLAGASGDENATGSAQKSAGPSAGYAGKIRAAVKPNIVFTEDIAGNPTAEVEVRTSPNGTIVFRKLVKKSGVNSWDEAVLKAIEKTETLPRDTDGRVPSSLIISFRPKD
jgi:colicin import membrane protein